MKNLFGQIGFEKWNPFYLGSQKLNSLILVVKNLPFEQFLIKGIAESHLSEFGERNSCHSVVIPRYDRSSSFAFINHADFSKMVAFSKETNSIMLLFILILNIDGAIALCEEKHVITYFVLFEDLLFGSCEHCTQFADKYSQKTLFLIIIFIRYLSIKFPISHIIFCFE